MTKSKLDRYVSMINRLIAAGYGRERAIAVVFYAYGLSPEQLAVVNQEVAA